MAASRPNTVNLALLAVTILSLMVAAYALLVGPPGSSRSNAARPACSNAGRDEVLSGRGGPDYESRPTRETHGEQAVTRQDGGPGDPGSSQAEGHRQPTGSTESRKPAEVAVATSETGKGTISGLVIDGEGRAVEGALVVARPTDQREQPRSQPDFESELAELERHIQRLRSQQRSATSGIDGRFVITGLHDAVAYDLSAAAPGGGAARLVRVACGDDVTLLLSRECLLRGKVTRQDGTPITRYRLLWMRADLPNEPGGERVVSGDGRYEVRVRPGRQTIWVMVEGAGVSDPVELDVPPAGAEANFTFAGLATLSGRVTDSLQNPLPEAVVRLTPLDEDDKSEVEALEGMGRGAVARCDSLGRYRFEAVAHGRYQITISLGARSETREIEVSGHGTQDFSLNAGARVTLKFRSPRGEAVTDVSVVFERRGRAERPTALPAEEPGVRVYIGLEPGDYSIRYFARGGAWARYEAKVIDGDNLFNLDIAEAAFVQGKVSGAGTPADLTVRLKPEGGKAENNQHYSAVVKADGTYRCGPALPGNYVLELVAQGRVVVYSASLRLGAGDNDQDVAVRDVASVSLRVQLPDGKPAPGARVTLTSGRNTFNARCDERGVARLSYVPAGECRIVAEAGGHRSREHGLTLRSGESDFALELKAPNCVRVTKVDKGSEAEKAGLQVNDLLFNYNGRDVTDRKSLDALIKEARNLESVTLSVDRGGRVMALTIKGGAFGGSYTDAVR